MIGTVTSKGQTTIPKQVREKLKLKPGDMVDWTVVGGHAIVRPKNRSILDIAGMFYDPNRKPMTIEEINEAVMDAVAEDVIKSMDRDK